MAGKRFYRAFPPCMAIACIFDGDAQRRFVQDVCHVFGHVFGRKGRLKYFSDGLCLNSVCCQTESA
jgi:hypothetical protein